MSVRSAIEFRFRYATQLVGGNLNIRGVRGYRFPPEQPWIKTPLAFTFVDETQEIVNVYEISTEDESSDPRCCIVTKEAQIRENTSPSFQPNCLLPESEVSVELSDADLSPQRPSETQSQPSTNTEFTISSILSHEEPPIPIQDGTSLLGTQSIGFHLLLDDYIGDSVASDTMSTGDLVHPPRNYQSHVSSPIYVEKPAWPLRDEQEGHLFRAFIKHIGPIFDLCDHENHFTRIVPQRAITCPSLFNAMLVASAKFLSKFENNHVPVGDEYLQRCLNTLIPALSSSAAAADENLLAAIVILRFIEEVDLPFSGNGSESHLIGTRVFLAAQKEHCEFTGLRLATFWSAVRQEIFTAVIRCRPVRLAGLATKISPFVNAEACECSYANRAIINCAECVQACFGESGLLHDKWADLQENLNEWWRERPWQFHPMVRVGESQSSSGLPSDLYLNDAVVTGLQHYYLAKIILLAHSPTLPGLGLSRKRVLDGIESDIKDMVHQICGIAKSHSGISTVFSVAALSITITADRFKERSEQQILYHILEMASQESPWTTQAIQTEVKDLWGWAS